MQNETEERLIEDAKAKARQFKGVMNSLLISQSEKLSEEYVSTAGFEGEEKENLKRVYKVVFEEMIQLI